MTSAENHQIRIPDGCFMNSVVANHKQFCSGKELAGLLNGIRGVFGLLPSVPVSVFTIRKAMDLLTSCAEE
jgi:hypothetical protein